MRSASLFKVALLTTTLFIPSAVQAQFDPRQPLLQLISAFQNCGPPQIYQMLSPQLFQLVAQQTNGMGCYAFIRQAGPILNMEVIEQQMFPVGPMYAIRVTHQAGPVDWYIGFSQASSRVEALTFKAATASAPPPEISNPGPTSPSPSGRTGGQPTPRTPDDSGDDSDCELYPAMC